MDEKTYRIVRFHFQGEREVIDTGLTLEEVKEHCSDPATSSRGDEHGKGAWFDGWEEE